MLHYAFKPGYHFPERTNKIVQMTNKVHCFFYHYFPDYNLWMFNYILTKELYVVINELNNDRIKFVCYTFSGQKMKFLKLMNCEIRARYLNMLLHHSEKVLVKN